MTILDTLNVATLTTPELIAEARSTLLAEADELLTRAGAELNGDDAEQFERIERVVGTLDARARIAAHHAATTNDPRQRVIDAAANGDRIEPDDRFTLPSLHVATEQLRALHEGFLDNRMTTVPLETRDAVAVPMALVAGQQLAPVPFRREPTRIASLIPAESITTASVTFYAQTTAASAAAVVAEGGAKPSSNPAWTATNLPTIKLAHITSVSTEALADYSNMRQVVEDEMIRGLLNKENLEVLLGTGIAGEMTGLEATSGILTYAPAGAEARFKSLLHALTLLRTGTAFIDADTIVLNPADHELLLLTPATTGELLVTQNPAEPGVERIWGVRIVISSQQTSGIALVGNLGIAAKVFVREAPTVRIDPFTLSANNMVRVIIEERLALGVGLPAALLKLTFNGTT